MKIKTYKEFLELIKPIHRANLDTMQLLVSITWFRKKVREARKTAGIPSGGYRLNDSTLIEKSGDGSLVFLPYRRLRQKLGKLEEFKGIIDQIISQATLPKNFEFSIKTYILYNEITAPVTNFLVKVSYDKNWNRSFPSPEHYKRLYINDKKLMDAAMEELSEDYPPLFTKPLREKPQLNNYLEVERLSKKKGKLYTKDLADNIGMVDYTSTDRDVALEVYGKEDKKSVNLVKKARELNDKRKKELFPKLKL